MLQLELKIGKFSENPRKIRKKTQFFNFRAEIFFRAERKRPRAEPSQAENPSARAMARASSARTHH